MGRNRGPQSFMKRQRERQKQLKQIEKLAQRRERSVAKKTNPQQDPYAELPSEYPIEPGNNP